MKILFGVLSIVFYLKGLVRVSVIHMAASIIPALALLAMVAKREIDWQQGRGGNYLWLCIFIAAVPTWNAAQIVRGRISQNIDVFTRSSMWSAPPTEEQAKAGSCRAPSGLERIACFKLDKNRIDAARFLQEHTNNNEVVFSGLTRHDKIFANDMMLYFVAKRQPATKWDLFAPGLQTRADIQNRDGIGTRR